MVMKGGEEYVVISPPESSRPQVSPRKFILLLLGESDGEPHSHNSLVDMVRKSFEITDTEARSVIRQLQEDGLIRIRDINSCVKIDEDLYRLRSGSFVELVDSPEGEG